jgi:NAD-dependent SIR2 family protein deacetylase
MRFLADGADIPDELIRAVTGGDAVFLCGAGVSRRAGMPSFRGLTERVYDKLGEAHANEPAERIAFERKEYDRALRSLEKRTHRPQTLSRVRVTVAELLTAPDGVEVPDHLALLQLSRDNEGRPRLLTTNFDTLFESAAQAGGLVNVPSTTVVVGFRLSYASDVSRGGRELWGPWIGRA